MERRRRRALSGSDDKPCGCGTWRRGAACACSKATRQASRAWRGAPTNAAPSPAPLTTPCGCGTWRRGAACASSKATPARSMSVAWSADSAAPSPARMTRPCGCGTWRRGAACACSKATRAWSRAWRGAPTNAAPSPARTTRPCGCGTWRRGAACACSKATRAAVRSVAWSADQRRAFSGDYSGGIRVWDLSEFVTEAPAPEAPAPASRPRRTKSSTRTPRSSSSARAARARRGFRSGWPRTTGSPATRRSAHGRRTGSCPWLRGDGVEREIWLWDFGGQADQRLIHQLYMDETALAVLVFDGQKEDLFETLGQWDRDLTRASRQAFAKLLVAGRVDAGGLRVSRTQIEAFAKERGYLQIPGDQRQDQPRLRGAQAGHPRRHPVGEHSVALLAAPLQAAQGGDHPPQGRRPGADAVQRAAGDAATAAVRRGRALHRRGAARGGEPAGRPRRGLGAEVRQLGAAPAGAHQRLRPGRDPDDARGRARTRLPAGGAGPERRPHVSLLDGAPRRRRGTVRPAGHAPDAGRARPLPARAHGQGAAADLPQLLPARTTGTGGAPGGAGELSLQRLPRRHLRHAGGAAAPHASPSSRTSSGATPPTSRRSPGSNWA